MILYFLRHGKAGSPRAANDDARELTEGRPAALRAAAPLWRRLNLRPDVVISSPLPRALRTAELFCEAVGGTPVTDDGLRPGASWGRPGPGHGGAPGRPARDVRRPRARPVGRDRRAHRGRIGPDAEGRPGRLEFYGIPEPGGGEIAWLLDPDLYADDDGSQ